MKHIFVLILLSTSAYCCGQKSVDRPSVVGSSLYDASKETYNELKGQEAPDFKSASLNGNEIRLSDHLGKSIVLNFWSLSCAACFKEISDFNRIVYENKDNDFVLISIMDDSKEELLKRIVPDGKFYGLNKTVFGNKAINYEIIPGGSNIMMLYDFVKENGFPLTFFIDKHGIIQDFSHGYLMSFEGIGTISNYDFLKEKLRKIINK